MNYQDVIKDSKFYLPMNLNLGYLLTNDTDIIVLMNVINCDTINEKLSVRKLMRYTNRSNNKIQQSLTRLRTLKFIDGFKPNYENMKYIFDSINNLQKIEERKEWCELYRKSIQKTVSKTGTPNCIENWYTDKEDIDKENNNKKDNLFNKEIFNKNIHKEKDKFINKFTEKENKVEIEKEFESPINIESIQDDSLKKPKVSREECIKRMETLYSDATSTSERKEVYNKIVQGVEKLLEDKRIDKYQHSSLKQTAWYKFVDAL